MFIIPKECSYQKDGGNKALCHYIFDLFLAPMSNYVETTRTLLVGKALMKHVLHTSESAWESKDTRELTS